MGVGGPNVKRQRFVNFHINSAFTAGRAEFMSRLTADPRAVLITIVHARRVSATHTHTHSDSTRREGVTGRAYDNFIRVSRVTPPLRLPLEFYPVAWISPVTYYFHWRICVHNVIHYIVYIRT